MANSFTTTAERPQWQSIYQLATGKPVGALITYEQLDEATGTDFRANRSALAKAVKALEENDRRTLACVVNEGYRIAAATDHEGLARNRHHRSRRQIARAVSLATNVHKDELDPEQTRRLESMETTLRAHADMLRRMGSRVERQEATLRDVRRRTSETTAGQNERIERLEALIARAGLAETQRD